MRGALKGLVRTVAVAILALAGAYQAYRFSVLPNLRLTSPELALAQAPDDPVSISKQVQLRTKRAGTYTAEPSDIAAARRSLVRAPLSRSSIRILGMQAVQDGQTDRARALMQLANRVARRDPWVESWLIEDAARRGDYAGAVRHFHAAMSVNSDLAPGLNPLMVKAAKDRRIRAQLRPYLRRNARWTPGFVLEAAKTAELGDLIDLIGPVSEHLGAREYEAGLSRAIYRLAAADRWEQAMQVAESAWPTFDAAEFTRVGLTGASTDPRLGGLAWQLASGDGVDVTLDTAGGIEVTLEPLARAQIASRDIRIPGEGSYLLTQRTNFIGSVSDAALTWQGYCIGATGTPTTQVLDETVPARAGSRTYRFPLNIPGNCALLSLRLAGRGADGGSAALVRITDLAVIRAR